MDNKVLIDALTQIPDLIKAAETYKETSNRIVSSLANAVKQHPQAVIPESEIQKLEQAIATTRCAMPEMSSFSKELARRLSSDTANAMGPIIKEKATAALKGASVTVEHSHVIERNLKSIVDEKMKNYIFILWIVIIFLLGVIGLSATAYYISDTYWGKEFYELFTSDYLTAEEKARLERNAGYTGILPQDYYKDPIGAQEQLKRNKAILKKREREANKNNGKFSADEMIENYSAK